MIILLLCIIAFVLIFGSKALIDLVLFLLGSAFLLAIAALVIGSIIGIVVFLYHEPIFLIAGLALAGIGAVIYLTGEMK